MTDARRPEGERCERFDVANEFAAVSVCRLRTRNGLRVRIESPRTGAAIDLDPLELELLAEQDHEFFSALLRGRPEDRSR